MVTIYYSDKYLIFGSCASLVGDEVIVTDARKAKLELFSDNAKPVRLISRDWELELQKFIATFELIEAAGGVVFNPQGKLLMIFRNGKWDLPKGKLEEGERMEECAVREVEEECGITGLSITTFRANTYHIYSIGERLILKRTWWYDMRCDNDREPTPQTTEGITAARWIGEGEVVDCLRNTYTTIHSILI